MKKTDFIAQLINQLDKLPLQDTGELDSIRKKTEMYVRNLFGESSKYLVDLKRIRFHPSVYPASEDSYMEYWKSGQKEFRNLLDTMLEELTIFGDIEDIPREQRRIELKNNPLNKNIFIVHGHNDGIKNEVARFLEKLKLHTTILHEKPNNGNTIIEKFEHESSSVNFAVILLTADDQGTAIDSEESLKYRARQNVIFEFGYFIGKLGRSRVVALVENDVELPSDFSGVVYITMDKNGAWKLSLAKELKSANIEIDMNLAT